MTPMPAREHYLSEFRRIEPALPGARLPWLASRRKHALEQFAERGFPTTRQEDWKYTNVSALERRIFKLSDERTHELSVEQLTALELAEVSHLLTFVDGRFARTLSRIGGLPAGVIVTNLAVALEDQAELLESCMVSEDPARPFAALNEAFFVDGALISVPAQTRVDLPIHLLFISRQADAMTHVRNLIRAGEGAQVSVIEHYVGLGEAAYFNNVVTTIAAGRSAKIEHHKLQQESVKAFHVAGIEAQQEQGSAFASYSFSLGGGLTRNDIHTTFAGESAEVLMNGLYMVGGRQHVDHHTRIDHAKPRCVSREFYKGIMDGASRAVFNGKVIVHKDAQHTDAQQTNKNLLLSEHAEVDTKPELEIYADDIKCAHGATVGQLDATQLFYLRSRGIDETAARTLLTFAFAEDIVSGVTFKPLRARLEQILVGRLPESEPLKELL